MNTGTQAYTVECRGVNRQFDFLEVPLVYDESDAHVTLYDSYSLELASTRIKSLTVENVLQTYSLSDKIKFDVNKKIGQYVLYR